MPDPIIAGLFRAQVILHGKSGLNTDVYVNNFVFDNTAGTLINATPADTAGAITTALQNFYTEATANAGRIASYLPSQVLQPDATVKVYDLGDAPPRLPYVNTFNLGAMSAAAPLPQEVACCLSYYAGRSLPRQRGRIYLGPLQSGVVVADSTTGHIKPADAFRTTVAEAAERLFTANGMEVEWQVLSQVDGMARRVTGGWVDDAFDTQRRRGSEPTSRILWGDPPAQV